MNGRILFLTLLGLSLVLSGCPEGSDLAEKAGISYDNEPDTGQPDVEPDAQPEPDVAPDEEVDREPECSRPRQFYADNDGDGYGGRLPVTACTAPRGHVSKSGDCNDSNAAINPAAEEVCDRVDNDCDGNVDAGAVDAFLWYQDADGDGQGNLNVTRRSCVPITGYVSSNGDCDDTNPQIYRGAARRCGGDYDCNGVRDDDESERNVEGALLRYRDGDQDSYGDPATVRASCAPIVGYVDNPSDCNDRNEDINPGRDELCSTRGVDDNCNGQIDEPAASDALEWRVDADADGYGAASDQNPIFACTTPDPIGNVRFVTVTDGIVDCDDANQLVHPGAAERCDEIDNDCDGLYDDLDPDRVGGEPRLVDGDGDGFGAEGVFELFCRLPSQGYTHQAGDCDDDNARVHPGAREICTNEIDDNCDGNVDSGDLVYTDTDGDGYGTGDGLELDCGAEIPDGYVTLAGDCDDGDAERFPGNTETCDEKDRDCDVNEDPFNGASDTTRFWFDLDRDTYGDAGHFEDVCVSQQDPLTVSNALDCNDTRSDIHPGAIEVCDGLDNNCNGVIDESLAIDAQVFWLDRDSDTYGDASVPILACRQPLGTSQNDQDCNDRNEDINPGAEEDCGPRDLNCDGDAVAGATIGRRLYNRDADGDTYGVDTEQELFCPAANPQGFVELSVLLDCDDDNARVHPGAREICGNDLDDDCREGDGNGQLVYTDADHDGYGTGEGLELDCGAEIPDGYVTLAGDCDDGDAQAFPGNREVCDDIDNDCNGQIDDSASDTQVAFRDADLDGLGDQGNERAFCAIPAGWVQNDLDCDDRNNTIGEITRYRDGDGDGHGNSERAISSCVSVPDYVLTADDCNDARSDIHPGATEVCDRVDNNCDGLIDDLDPELLDEDLSVTGYTDTDLDTFGVDGTVRTFCFRLPQGFSSRAGDCNDGNAAINPGALEICANGVDDDCQGGDNNGQTVYPDSDRDGYGAGVGQTQNCNEQVPQGFSREAGDCNDADASINPGAAEDCSDTDRNCDSFVTRGATVGLSTFFLDGDSDLFGDPLRTHEGCTPPAFFIQDATDCNDANPGINPAAAEDCSDIDRNCDGDPIAGATDKSTFFFDGDGDGHGNAQDQIMACTAPNRYVLTADDCNDARSDIYPGATEVCDRVDNNCDDLIDDLDPNLFDEDLIVIGFSDTDQDTYGEGAAQTFCFRLPQGFSLRAGDCNDGNSAVNPGVIEVCNNNVDDDCDGEVDGGDELFVDADGDGYGTLSEIVLHACDGEVPEGFSLLATDCNDDDPTIHPTAPEDCSDVDRNCDEFPRRGATLGRSTLVHDGDQDGFGANGTQIRVCLPRDFYVPEPEDPSQFDCNDVNASTNPGAFEDCHTINVDDNCNGVSDEGGEETHNTHLVFSDNDRDGYGVGEGVLVCVDPEASAQEAGDCNDNNNQVFPGAREVCNELDDDCDGAVDEGLPRTTFYRDADGDGFGNPSATRNRCRAPSGFVSDNTDCNDRNSSINPDAGEICDNDVDENCDDIVGICEEPAPEPDPGDDVDDDGDGITENEGDCDDTEALISPAATEACQGSIDFDCDGLLGLDDPDAVCAGVITCGPVDENGDRSVNVNGDITGTLINDPDLLGEIVFLEVGTARNDCFNELSDCGQVDFLGDHIDHMLTFADADFTPRVQTDADPQETVFMDLLLWEVIGGDVVIDEFHTGLIARCAAE